MARDSTAVVVAGSGGAGAITAGSILLRAAACAGDHVAQIDELLEREPVPHPDWARDCDPPAEPE